MTTMTTKVIPHGEWGSFLDRFSREHEGELVAVEVFEPETGIDLEGASLRFMGATGDFKDGENEIILMMASPDGGHISHAVAAPTRLSVERSALAMAGFEALVIEARGGVTTSVRFSTGDVPAASGS